MSRGCRLSPSELKDAAAVISVLYFIPHVQKQRRRKELNSRFSRYEDLVISKIRFSQILNYNGSVYKIPQPPPPADDTKAEAFGTAASVIGLIGTAFSIFQEVRKAQAKVKGASKSLQAVTGYVESVEQSLNLVEREPALQTPQIIQQLTAIGEIALNLREFLDQLVVQQQRRAVAQFVHALKAGDAEEKELDKILGRLDQGRSELVLRIQLAQVGLMGNMQSGFRVAFGVLNETNNRVNSILGVNLELAELLKGRQYRETGTTETFLFLRYPVHGQLTYYRWNNRSRSHRHSEATAVRRNTTTGEYSLD